MNLPASLLGLADQLATTRLDVFQYLNRTPSTQCLPYNIRVFLRQRPASQLGRAIHNQHTLAIALRTSGGAIIDNRFIRLTPGRALLIFPRQIHDYVDIEQHEVLWLFCGFLLDDNEAYKTLRFNPVALCPQAFPDIEALVRLALQPEVNSTLDADSRGLRLALRLKLLLEQLLDSRWQELSTNEGNKSAQDATHDDNPLVAHTCRFISTHLQDYISIEDIATHLHVSPGHLRNEFRRRTGCSLGRYIRYIKMHNACSLMNTTNLSLAEVGERCGYSSIFAFSRAFKKDKGIAPSEYRHQYANTNTKMN